MTSLSLSATRKLANGVHIPLLGLGVYQSRGDECTAAVTAALKAGYRHIDCALAYTNEKLVGQAINASGVARSDVFFTTKLPPKSRGYDATKKAIAESLSNCEIGYIDLYLIHAPYGNKESRLGQWKAIEEAVISNQIRAAGVSNYGIHHIQELIESEPSIMPQVNQIELHPWLCRNDLVDYCLKHDIALEAYSPLTRGQKLADSDLVNLAETIGQSSAQVLIRWSLQKGMCFGQAHVMHAC